MAKGTYVQVGATCPSSAAQLSGSPRYIEGPCNISVKGNGTDNSTASPGYLVLVNGTLSFGGHTTFDV